MAAVLVYSHWVEPAMLLVREVDVAIPSLPAALDGYRILVASDLHSTWFGEGQSRVEEALRRLEAKSPDGRAFDAAVVVGDLVDAHRPTTEPGRAFLGLLAKRAPTYLSLGNHDEIEPEPVIVAAREAGAVVLGPEPPFDRSAPAPQVIFLGTEHWHPATEEVTREVEFARALAARGGQPDPFIVFAIHSPARDLALAAAGAGAGLVVSGHDHGGQLAVPIIGPLWTPTSGWFPGRSVGLFNVDGMPQFVSGGLGNSVVPFRMFVPPTITILRLVKAETGP